MGPTCSPSTTRCQPPSAAGAAAASGPPDSPPRTTMMWLHFLQRILKTFPRTLSSEIEYLVPQESQMIFINASIRRSRRHARAVSCYEEGAIALPLAGTDAHYIEVAAACKRRGGEILRIPQIKTALMRGFKNQSVALSVAKG